MCSDCKWWRFFYRKTTNDGVCLYSYVNPVPASMYDADDAGAEDAKSCPCFSQCGQPLTPAEHDELMDLRAMRREAVDVLRASRNDETWLAEVALSRVLGVGPDYPMDDWKKGEES
jgi:hypothetical protein